METTLTESNPFEVPIVVTNVLPTGSAFGATVCEPREAVFIPSRVARAFPLTVGVQVLAVLVPNAQRRTTTPWLAHMIRRDSHAAPMSADVFLATLADAYMSENATAGQVADAVASWAEGKYADALRALRDRRRA